MKAGKAHRVPLCDRALAILDAIEPLADRRARLSRPAARQAALQHGVRRAHGAHGGDGRHLARLPISFRDWAGEATTFPREVAEAALAHAVGDAVELAYRRGDALAKRRKLMDAWAAFLAKGKAEAAGNVVALRRA